MRMRAAPPANSPPPWEHKLGRIRRLYGMGMEFTGVGDWACSAYGVRAWAWTFLGTM